MLLPVWPNFLHTPPPSRVINHSILPFFSPILLLLFDRSLGKPELIPTFMVRRRVLNTTPV